MKKNQKQNFQQANKSTPQRQSEEFGYETDVNEVQKQNTKAEQQKTQASGRFSKTNQDLGE